MDQPELASSARRITLNLFAVQSLGSAGVISALTVAAIVGADLSGRAALAGVPAGLFQLGGALTALPWSLATDSLGRRWGLALAVAVGSLGAMGSVAAVAAGSFPLLMVGLLVMGSAQAAFRLSRFAAAEVNPRARRGRAVATVVLGGTVGSVLGPLLVGPSGAVSQLLGLGALAGPYLVSALLFLLAAAILAAGLRPEPLHIAALVSAAEDDRGTTLRARTVPILLRDAGVRTAVALTVGAQVVMVMVMVMTSLHMRDHDHDLGNISLVIAAHTLGMFAFSPLSGRLADGWGRRPTLALGAVILFIGCMASIPSPELLPLVGSLFVLGLGWNLCFVAGSALLSDRLSPPERARMQGVNDLLIGIPAAAASLVSGLVYAAAGYAVMSWSGALLSLLLLLLLWQERTTSRAAAPAD